MRGTVLWTAIGAMVLLTLFAIAGELIYREVQAEVGVGVTETSNIFYSIIELLIPVYMFIVAVSLLYEIGKKLWGR